MITINFNIDSKTPSVFAQDKSRSTDEVMEIINKKIDYLRKRYGKPMPKCTGKECNLWKICNTKHCIWNEDKLVWERKLPERTILYNPWTGFSYLD